MRSSRGRFAAMRRGAMKNRPIWAIPTGPGSYGPDGIGRDEQVHLRYFDPGNLSSGGAPGASQGWLFALTPESFERDGDTPDGIPGLILGKQQDTYDNRYRIAGFSGQLLWSPQAPIGEQSANPPPDTLSGVAHFLWYKFEAGQSDSTAGFKRSYPWLSFSTVDAKAGVDTLVPFEVMPGGAALTFLDDRDYRYRAKVIRSATIPWKIDASVTGDSVDGYNTVFSPRVYRVPLPRKLVCNVGRGEALGLAYWIRDFTVVNTAGGAPASVFDFSSLRVKLYELS